MTKMNKFIQLNTNIKDLEKAKDILKDKGHNTDTIESVIAQLEFDLKYLDN